MERGDRAVVAHPRRERLIAAPPPADTVAPRLSARVPGHVRIAGNGALRLPVRVDRPDGCDVRARLIGRVGEVAWAVGDLRPGGETTLSVTADAECASCSRSSGRTGCGST